MKQKIIDLVSKMLKETDPDQVKKILIELYQKIGAPNTAHKPFSEGISNAELLKNVRNFCSTPNLKNRKKLESLIRDIEAEP